VEIEYFGLVDMHFIHRKSSAKVAIHLIFCHGWPGSFLEVTKMLPLLGESAPPFPVVAPSMPNFGFSGSMLKRGFGIQQIC
jgi:pimeloyl-ACP methyl ester carboxylesterase